MTVARNIAEAFEEHVTFEVESIDRLYLNLYQPLLQTLDGAGHVFRSVRAKPLPSSALAAPITRDSVAASEGSTRAGSLDLVAFENDERTRGYLQKWPDGEGVLYSGKPCMNGPSTSSASWSGDASLL